jgi:hypothetical protein
VLRAKAPVRRRGVHLPRASDQLRRRRRRPHSGLLGDDALKSTRPRCGVVIAIISYDRMEALKCAKGCCMHVWSQ